MASSMKVLLLLLLLLDAGTAEDAVAPDDEVARIRGLWKLQMKELKGKGGSENGIKIKFNFIFCVNATKTDDDECH